MSHATDPLLRNAPRIDYATGTQKQALVTELARRNDRWLTCLVLLDILRMTEAKADHLLTGGGLDALQAKRAGFDAAYEAQRVTTGRLQSA